MSDQQNNQFDPLWTEADLGQTPGKRRRGKKPGQGQVSTGGGIRTLDVKDVWPACRKKMFEKKSDRIRTFCVLAALIIGGGVALYFVVRPTPMPDYERDDLNRVFSYTLLTSEFNNLPIEERLELIGMLYQRLRNMDNNDAMLMGAFAAGLAGQAREQLEQNASRLMIDTADLFASEYSNVPRDQREAFLEEAYVRLSEMMETFAGRTRDIEPEERLARARRQAQRDDERLRNRPISERRADRLFTFVNDGIGEHATPQQRGRISNLMLDMTRHLRGEDISSGRRLPGGG